MLLVDHVELMAGGDFEKGKRISPAGISVSSLNIRFRNYGTGPAIIEKAVANLRLIPEPTPFYGHDQPHDFRDCIELTQAMC